MAGERGYQGEQWANKDYYAILGVSSKANTNEIRSAWRKFALKHHPDKNPGDPKAEENFKLGAEAYGVLSDPDKKRQYDMFSNFDRGAESSGSGSAHFYEETHQTSYTGQRQQESTNTTEPPPQPKPKKPETFKERFEKEFGKEQEKAKRWQEKFGFGKKKE